ncbi:MAG: hypothetical protein DRO11_02785 [Methanobacteriota archaeon]|nr:MAG: hypothetical protein DRO11_02785 [Euryarchaeota archaeon]
MENNVRLWLEEQLGEGEEVWVGELGSDTGLVVRSMSYAVAEGAPRRYAMRVLCIKNSYKSAKDLAEQVRALLESKRRGIGLDWALAGQVEVENFGEDERGKYCAAVGFDVIEEV